MLDAGFFQRTADALANDPLVVTPPAKKWFRWKRTYHSHRNKQNPKPKQLKQASLVALKLTVQEGYTRVEASG